MDTNLKTGKKIRSFLYRMIALCAFIITIASAGLGREALINLYQEGPGTLTGEIYYLTEFRELTSSIYTHALLSYAGVGDDNGYPLTSDSAFVLSKTYLSSLGDKLTHCNEDLLYYMQYSKGTGKFKVTEIYKNNFTYPLFSEYDGHLLLPENVTLCCYWDGTNNSLSFFTDPSHPNGVNPERYYASQYKPVADNVDNLTILIALRDTDEYTSPYISQLATTAANYRNVLFLIICSGITTIFFGFISLLTCRSATVSLKNFAALTKYIRGEIKILLLAGVLFLCYNSNLFFFTGTSGSRFRALPYFGLYIPLTIITYLFFNDLKHNGLKLFTYSFTHSCISYIVSYCKGVKWYRKASLICIITFICSILLIISGGFITYVNISQTARYAWLIRQQNFYLTGLAFVICGILLFFISIRLKRFISDVSFITMKLSDISTGNTYTTDSNITLSKNSLLAEAALNLQDVEHGIETAVEQSTKANKMRVELITNVSHDLKTPLTSIINYADLLCDEKLPAPADEYVVALRTKAYRLKGMVQDVFDLSKATSGNLRLDTTCLDLAKLVHQTLADMDERIQKSTLNFKLNISKEPLFIQADGEKLYRVFQNLIINALQYSLDYSRVYIQIEKQDDRAVAYVKNTSKQELTFSPQEIVERFVRADTSRTTEGSGLGLSIAQSFTESCGGTFTIELNADLFSACVSFPLTVEAASIDE